MGVNTTRYKVRAFVIAAFFAGIAGGLFAHTNGVQLNPTELGFMKSFDIIIMVVLGGMGSISGATIAAVILTILPELLREPPSFLNPTGAVFLAVVCGLCVAFARKRVRAIVMLVLAVAGWEVLRQLAKAGGVNLAEYRMVIFALALIIMMIVRPQGLFGVREIWEPRSARGKKA
jgi:branched-chain amino acid transport system permease protein